ncbi:MAG: hypothetical protein DRJ40_02525 [Thermoprotei archaeon]|nr:MAG: hypothetical protein DRJ40_02525 [Thermoprotei archaeon]
MKQLNIDLDTLVIELLIKELNISSREEIQIHLQLAQKHFEEAKKYLTENNLVQASEKLYKCAEECIKALAMKYRVPEVEEYRREGR